MNRDMFKKKKVMAKKVGPFWSAKKTGLSPLAFYLVGTNSKLFRRAN